MRIALFLLGGAGACILGVQALRAQSTSDTNGDGPAVSSSAAPLLPDDLKKIFLSACFDGTFNLSAGQGSPVTVGDVPPDLRRSFGTPLSGSIWRLNGTTPTYLYAMNYKPSSTSIPKVCGLATQSIPIEAAIQFLGARENGPSLTSFHESFAGADWLNAKGGYDAATYKFDQFTVLELKMLSKKQQKRALKLVPTLGRVIPAE